MEKEETSSWADVHIVKDEAKAPIRIKDRLSYHIPELLLQKLQAQPQASTYWSYEWYENVEGKNVKVSYASTREVSEELAKRFLNEKVLGFDMEWKADWNKKRRNSRTLKEEISLIQVASAEEIGLFHIALHKGTRPAELLARSLRKIIESSSIIKTGVGIYSVDATRLRKFMGLKPQGILDLNNFHRIVENSSRTKIASLSNHSKVHLGFPLFKGNVRTSDWTKPLTPAQQSYAASDAYVGLVLYHVLDVKRLNMDPTPPHPELDKNSNPRYQAAELVPQLAQPAQAMSTLIVPQPDSPQQATRRRTNSRKIMVQYKETSNIPQMFPLDPSGAIESAPCRTALATPTPTLTQSVSLNNERRRLLANLHSLRYRLHKNTGIPFESIASDKTLQYIADQRPASVGALCRIPGAGKMYMTCQAQKVDLLGCIMTPPTSVSFDSSLSCTNAKSMEATQRQPLARTP